MSLSHFCSVTFKLNHPKNGEDRMIEMYKILTGKYDVDVTKGD